MAVFAILAAAGNSARMGSPKLFLKIKGRSVFSLALQAVAEHSVIDAVVVVTKPEFFDIINAECDKYCRDAVRAKPYRIVAGGNTRQQSVANGILACKAFEMDDLQDNYYLIHDAARPFVTQQAITNVIADAMKYGAACLAVPVKDTIKQVEEGEKFVTCTPARTTLFAAQTPQVFCVEKYENALKLAQNRGLEYTDDCGMLEAAGVQIYLTEGEYSNYKITTPEDLPKESVGRMRIGHGYDVHRVVADRKLILGGVEIPWEKGLLGHSDADVLLHSIMDALLGAMGLGDIGGLFPDTDPQYAGISSMLLLEQVVAKMYEKGFELGNLDATIVAQQPKLASYIPAMREAVAKTLDCVADCVNIKATTEEKLGFTGSGEGIAAHAVVLLNKTSCD